MNIIEARTYDIDGNLIEVLTGRDARAIAEVPNLIEALKEFIDLCPRMSENDPIASALANQCKYAKLILKRIEG